MPRSPEGGRVRAGLFPAMALAALSLTACSTLKGMAVQALADTDGVELHPSLTQPPRDPAPAGMALWLGGHEVGPSLMLQRFQSSGYVSVAFMDRDGSEIIYDSQEFLEVEVSPAGVVSFEQYREGEFGGYFLGRATGRATATFRLMDRTEYVEGTYAHWVATITVEVGSPRGPPNPESPER